MNTASNARKNLKYLASLVRGLMALDEELEEAGSLEQMVLQKQGVIDGLDKKEAALRERLTTLASEIATRTKTITEMENAAAAKISAIDAETEATRKEGAEAADHLAKEIDAMKAGAARD